MCFLYEVLLLYKKTAVQGTAAKGQYSAVVAASEAQATPVVNRYTEKGPIPLSANYRQEGRPFSLGDRGLLAQLFGQFGFIATAHRSHPSTGRSNHLNDRSQKCEQRCHRFTPLSFFKVDSIITATAVNDMVETVT